MLLSEPNLPQDVPKIIQPRNHKAKICVWSDLTVDDIDRLDESLNSDHIKQVLADIFHLDDHKENLKSGIVMDLYFYTLEFAKDNNFSKEKISAFFSIIKKTHEVCIETPFGNVDQTFNYFKELLLCHAVNRPPHSIELFSPDEVRRITEYAVNTYFRHFKMYKYAFTPLVRLDLSLSYVGVPVTPPPSEEKELIENSHSNDDEIDFMEITAAEEDEEGKAEVAEGESPEGDVGVPDGASEHKTPEPDESPARKELRQMIQGYLADEIKKMKLSVEEQIKSTEDTLNKKIDTVEGVSKKGGKGSAKGKKK